MQKRSIGIIGGGAAGMMAAIIAARFGAEVTILEGSDRIGQKILSTGNGKCNLGNKNLSAEQYHGASKDFLASCFAQFGVEETISFFGEIGLLLKEKNGYLYPFCEQASAVLDVLRYEIASLNIKIVCGYKVHKIAAVSDGFRVSGTGKTMCFQKLIIACGGKAAPKTGSDGSGYDLAMQLGHSIVPVVPALTFLKCKEGFFKAIAGVRTEAEISIMDRNNVLFSERGELQLTEQGISGIPVFQLSGRAAYLLQKNQELSVKLDFLPDYEMESLMEIYLDRKINLKERTAEEFFTGILNKKVMSLFLRLNNLKPTEKIDNIPADKLLEVFYLCKSLYVTAYESGSFQNAQVCAGGVNTGEITTNMESLKHKGLYFVGELLDVDGKCGGYNLQWAWTSGYLAGYHATH